MLPKEIRLNLAQARWRFKHADFDFSTPYFKVVLKKNGFNSSRFGFLFTSKIGKATKRNYFRRLLTEVVYSRIEKFPAGLDFVFIAYPKIQEADYEKISISLDQVLSKIPFT